MAEFPVVKVTELVSVLGPCPGCDAWTLESPLSEDPAVIEGMLLEHAMWECPALMAKALDAYAARHGNS